MLTCLSCDQPISDPRAAFCSRCGQPLPGAPGQPPTPPPAGGQAGSLNVPSASSGAAAPPLPGPLPAAQPFAVFPSQPPGKSPGQVERRLRLLPGIGGLVCGALGILAFFALPWWIYVNTVLPNLNETFSAWELTNPALAPAAPSFVMLLWLIVAGGLLLGLLGILHLVGAGPRKILSSIQLVGAFIGLVTVTGYLSDVLGRAVSPDAHISYGPGFWIALLAFVGAIVLVIIDLARRTPTV